MTVGPGLPPIDPHVAAELLTALPGRLAKRVSSYAAEADSWLVETVDDAVVVHLGGERVTLSPTKDGLDSTSQLRCSCLLSPRCAHLGAVLAAAPVSDRSPVEGGTSDGSHPAESGQQETTTLTLTELAALELADRALAALLCYGAIHLSPNHYAELLSAVHRLRVAGLVTAAAGFTSLTEQVRRRRAGADAADRRDLLSAASRSAITLQQLRFHHSQGTVTDTDRGSARRRYVPVGNLDLLPIACEPLLTDTGYNGVIVTFVDSTGRFWSLPTVQPQHGAPNHDSRTQLQQTYRGASTLPGVATPVRELGRRRVFLANATASADGRLGAGSGVQAAAGDLVAPEVAWAGLPTFEDAPNDPANDTTGFSLLGGEVSVDGSTLLINGVPVRLSHAAWQVNPLWTVRVAQAWRGSTVSALVRLDSPGADPTLLALAPTDSALPKPLVGRIFPGLDRLDANVLGNRSAARVGHQVEAVDPSRWEQPARDDVAMRLTRWLGRLVVDGRRALLIGAQQMQTDAAALAQGAAPTASRALTQLHEGARAGTHRFDGSWQPDDDALRIAFTRVAAYLSPASPMPNR